MNTTRIEFAPGHEDEAITEQDVAAKLRLMKLAPRMLKALQWLEMLQERPGENSLQRFERVAEVFRRDTGYLRPGKNCVLHSPEERLAAWDAWVQQHIGEVRAILAEAEGRGYEHRTLAGGATEVRCTDLGGRLPKPPLGAAPAEPVKKACDEPPITPLAPSQPAAPEGATHTDTGDGDIRPLISQPAAPTEWQSGPPPERGWYDSYCFDCKDPVPPLYMSSFWNGSRWTHNTAAPNAHHVVDDNGWCCVWRGPASSAPTGRSRRHEHGR